MPVANGEILRIAARMSYAEDDFVNVFHIRADQDVPDDSNARFAAQQFVDEWYDPIVGVLHVGMGFDDIKIDKVAWLAGKEITQYVFGIWDWPTQTTGTGNGEALPHGVAALITGFTEAVKCYARKFIGRIPESLSDTDGWESAAMTSLNNAAVLLATQFQDSFGNLWTPVVHSIRSGEWEPIISTAVRAIASYQRRRKPGVGS